MKRIIALTLTLLLTLSLLSGCGAKKNSKTLTVAASATPHAEILEQCVEKMAQKGFTLKIRMMDDYIIPNNSTENGDVDANYFQHTPYLEEFNVERGTHLVSVGKIHYEPYAIYKGTESDLANIKDGAKIAVPNDATNEARALMLLEANGLIKLKAGAGLTATKKDIAENKKNLEIIELAAELLPKNLSEVAVAVINGNFAINAGLKVSEALAVEDANSAAAQTYANILVVKEGNEDNEAVKALLEILKSDEIKDFINEKYDGAVLPID